MSRKRTRATSRKGGNVAPFSTNSLNQPPPLQMQVRACLRGIERLAQHLGELELMVEFTMRRFTLQRPKAGGLIVSGNKPEMERMSLMQLYAQQREAFAEALMKERHEIARAQAAAEGEHSSGNGHADAIDDAETTPELDADAAEHVTDSGIILPSC